MALLFRVASCSAWLPAHFPTAPAAQGQHQGSSQESSLKRQNSAGGPSPGQPPPCGSCSRHLAPRGDHQSGGWVSADLGAPHQPQTAGPWSFRGEREKQTSTLSEPPLPMFPVQHPKSNLETPPSSSQTEAQKWNLLSLPGQ